jgi:hypothetical protein
MKLAKKKTALKSGVPNTFGFSASNLKEKIRFCGRHLHLHWVKLPSPAPKPNPKLFMEIIILAIWTQNMFLDD